MKAAAAILPLLIGFILDMILGDPYNMPHPVRLIGNTISLGEKVFRKNIADERKAGTCLAICVIIIFTAAAEGIKILCFSINQWFGIVIEGIMCYYLIAAKCLKDESMKVFGKIDENDVEGARKAVSMIVGRDTKPLDRSGIIKAAVETVAENTSDGVTAPMLWVMLFGAAGGYFYKAVNTMDSMIGYKNEKYIKFGRFAAKLDDFVNFLPSRITAVIMIISAYLLKLDGKNAAKIWKRDRRNHASPNSAQTESVCAGALDVMLAGDAYYFGRLLKKPTIGDDIRPIENMDIVRANRLMYMSSVITLFISCAVRWLIWR